jgi:Sad1 / UNC-like C-terminal
MRDPSLASKAQQILLLLVWAVSTLCSGVAATTVRSASAASSNAATCPSRTVNYITHSLPQRCPTSRRSTVSIAGPTLGRLSETTSQKSATSAHLTTTAAERATLVQTSGFGETATRDPSILQTRSQSTVPEDEDSESPLRDDGFLSFEEWKRRNLDKYGQSADQIGQPRKHDSQKPRIRPVNELDSFGEEGEIDLDFSAFAPEKPQIAIPAQGDVAGQAQADQKHVPAARSRSKDAGTTFKERFNYASFDCAATVLKTNVKSSGSGTILVENKDSYMLNECSVENKFVILELCEDILIDTIVLANFEFFSSIFRTFRVSVSDKYPVKLDKWKVLGTFEARNTREVQAFLVENPLIWTRYVRIEFLTHYGNEYYCPLSLVRVHGTTMLQDYRHDEEPNKGEDQDDEEELVPEKHGTVEKVVPEAVAEVLLQEESAKTTTQQKNSSCVVEAIGDIDNLPENITPSTDERDQLMPTLPPTSSWSKFDLGGPKCTTPPDSSDAVSSKPDVSPVRMSRDSGTPASSSPAGQNGEAITDRETAANKPESAAPEHPPAAVESTIPAKSTSTRQAAQHSETSVSTKTASSASLEMSKPPVTNTQPPPSNPTIQESFFKTVQKRLQMLESNSTLSLQYIEEQSRMLRDAFSKVEQRQLSKATRLLDYLNGTVLSELRDFRLQYDQLWQSTIIEMETQREQHQREALAMNTRLGILADEVVFQKRMAMLQSILVLFCIGVVLFSRGAVNSYLDHPLLQNMMSRSSTLRMRSSFMDTPNMSPESTRPNSSYNSVAKPVNGILKSHRRGLSDDFQDPDGAENPAIAYSPPTPASYDGQSEAEVDEKEDEPEPFRSPSPDVADMQRSSSSPPVIHRPMEDRAITTEIMDENDDEDPPHSSKLVSAHGLSGQPDAPKPETHLSDLISAQPLEDGFASPAVEEPLSALSANSRDSPNRR